MSRRVAISRFSPAAVLALSLIVPSTGLAKTVAKSAAVANVAIDNFGQVSPTYYRGGQPKGADYTTLAALGVKTVIDLQADGDPSEAALVKRAGMTYVQIPMTTHTVPTPKQIEQFLSLVNGAQSQPVYVHCAGGRHRTGVMTAIYRMTNMGWTASKAFQEMKDYKFGLDLLHPEFKSFVLAYTPAATAVAEAR